MTEDSKNLQSLYNKLTFELRQSKLEKEHVQRSNLYYVAQVSQMEVKISELKAMLKSKDNEIEDFQQTVEALQGELSSKPGYPEDESHLSLLEEENEYLKSIMQGQGDIVDLKIKLEHALTMKETFEEKYRETKTDLLSYENSDSSSELVTLRKCAEELELDNRNLKEHYIPQLHSELESSTNQKFLLEAQVEFLMNKCAQLENQLEDQEQEPRRVDLHIRTGHFTPQEAPREMQRNMENPQRELSTSASTSVVHSRTQYTPKIAEYVPSFQRTQKGGKGRPPEVLLNLDDSDNEKE